MNLPTSLVEGVLLERENRYRARVHLATGDVAAFVPNPGRTLELLYPGARVMVHPVAPSATRRTAYDMLLVYTADGLLVSIDTRLATRLFAEALATSQIAPLAGYTVARPEVVFGASRLDFSLVAPERRPCLVEVKSSTLVEVGVARWPDSPSLRGQRHARELIHAIQEGYRAVIVWIVQRPDAHCLTPHDGIDPVFAVTLAEAVAAGVEAYAYTCRVTTERVEVLAPIPVQLAAPPDSS